MGVVEGEEEAIDSKVAIFIVVEPIVRLGNAVVVIVVGVI